MFTLGYHELIVGLGSNAANALEILRLARRELRNHPSFSFLNCSSLYSSDALLPPHSPPDWNRPYLNAACLLESVIDHSADQIISIFKNIEKSFGRVESLRWAPRSIDLDLLVWGKPNISSSTATVPHPHLMDRPFALLPAQDCVKKRRSSSFCLHPWRLAHLEQVPLRTQIAPVFWPEIVGILNVTPDSFSDGHPEYVNLDITEKVTQMVHHGASVIDIGAESTRPGAIALTVHNERERLLFSLDVLTALKRQLGFKISLDSRNPETVEWALGKYPIDWINDVGGFSDSKMVDIAIQFPEVKLVVMHSLSVPPQREKVISAEVDPVIEVMKWGSLQISKLLDRGISADRIIFDPGFGFGKTAAQNLVLFESLEKLNALRVSLLIGHSRKGFLDAENKIPFVDRDLETAILTSRVQSSGVDYIRVHSPLIQTRALKIGSRLL